MAANAKSILFGDLSNYFIRDALDIMVIRRDERYADTLEVGFLQRTDGNLVNAGLNRSSTTPTAPRSVWQFSGRRPFTSRRSRPLTWLR